LMEPAGPPAPAMPATAPVLQRACQGVALFGGVLLMALAALTTVSVASRALTRVAIPGDVEIAELLTACAIFCFIPYCELQRGHVAVDAFTDRMPPRALAALECLWATVFLAIAALLLWQISIGAADLLRRGQTTFVLRLPVWIAFIVVLPAAALLVAACAHSVVQLWRRARAG